MILLKLSESILLFLAQFRWMEFFLEETLIDVDKVEEYFLRLLALKLGVANIIEEIYLICLR